MIVNIKDKNLKILPLKIQHQIYFKKQDLHLNKVWTNFRWILKKWNNLLVVGNEPLKKQLSWLRKPTVQ